MDVTHLQPAPALRRARFATSTIFAVHGAVTGTFAARVPWVADHVGTGAGGLGIALLMPGVGALLAMPLSARLAHRFDLRWLIRVLIACWAAALMLPALPTTLPVLCVALAVYGATAGLADVAMNAHAVVVEERYERSVMSGFHGWWSVGGLAGSVGGVFAARAGLGAPLHFALTSAVLIAVSILVSFWLLSHRPEPTLDEPPAFALPSRAVLPIGLIGLCAVFAEGASLDWSAVYMRDLLGSPAATAAATVSIFSVCMAVARFGGDWVVRRLGPVTAVRLSGVVATIGALIVVLARPAALVIAGFGLLGIGIAVVIPLVFAAAGRLPGHPGRNIAGVAGIAYGSGLIAPGVIGGIAHVSSLTVSFVVIVGLVAIMGLGAVVLRPHGKSL
ncbi:putative MFS family arabinose efflux permease [Actinoplanes tereljensis]|uniref:MFS transporter n=1 Tax=Paractinoplanes tereljensis TaxID=571912 RepID=A0A919TSW1_9ACTN|nr:MFS transporter [Actinoplanes tereljensis]GIF20991.1 MFS transporter [Actinoplanes tereljensis]